MVKYEPNRKANGIDKVINILYRIIIDTIVNQIIKMGGGIQMHYV